MFHPVTCNNGGQHSKCSLLRTDGRTRYVVSYVLQSCVCVCVEWRHWHSVSFFISCFIQWRVEVWADWGQQGKCSPLRTPELYAIYSNVGGYQCKSSLSRRDAVLINRLRIDHTRLTHSYLLSGDDQPVCSACQSPLTVKHFLIECVNFAAIRSRYFRNSFLWATLTFSY